MQIHTTAASLRNALSHTKDVAFAPTMGNLHDGHASLMRAARQHAGTAVASIFVNRLQFGPNEDFDSYPRTFEADCARLEAAGVDHLYAPSEPELYPVAQTYYVVPAAAHDSILEGQFRPIHFRGVATVVTKLLNIVQPAVALFGKKDYQQLMIIRNLVDQLALPITIVGCDTVRADNGLALSSRNGYLSAAELAEAPRLYATLRAASEQAVKTPHALASIEAEAVETLKRHGWQPDYVAIRRRSDLQPPQPGDSRVIVAAARLGHTRLIDNLEF